LEEIKFKKYKDFRLFITISNLNVTVDIRGNLSDYYEKSITILSGIVQSPVANIGLITKMTDLIIN